MIKHLKSVQQNKPMLFSAIETKVSSQDNELIRQASLELVDLVEGSDAQTILLSGKPEISQAYQGNLSSMIGIDFHLTDEGPKIIEVNTNAGGLITSALWAYKDNHTMLKEVATKIIAMFEVEFEQWATYRCKTKKLQHIVIIDENPEEEFTYDDFVFMSALFTSAGYTVSIVKTNNLEVQDEQVYVQGVGLAVDLIYNRDCDFYMSQSHTQVLKEVYEQGFSCVTPNPFGYALLSDKRNLEVLYHWLNQAIEGSRFSTLKATMLPTISLKQFLEQGISKNTWFFKPVNAFAGRGVFRGKKVSNVKFNTLEVEQYIAQKEASPSTMIFNNQSYKYDIRVFVYKNTVIDISSRVYQGRITNFRTEYGGYSPVVVEK